MDFGYLIAGVIGFFIGVIVSCFLLAKKNLETFKKVEKNVSEQVVDNVDFAKAMYNARVAAYENGAEKEDTGNNDKGAVE